VKRGSASAPEDNGDDDDDRMSGRAFATRQVSRARDSRCHF
jgi:hypothetical protein